MKRVFTAVPRGKGGLFIKPKPIEQLTITDDFMFGAVMRNPELCKELLELILNVKIREIRYAETQKTIEERYASKGIRLDVYVEDEAGTVYDVEIQTTDKKELPKRTRYYQGLIDLHILDKGEDYRKLRKSYVIFICTYDPFGLGRWVYTFENRCREAPELALRDDAVKILLNTNGSVGEISGELKALLRYMAGEKPESDYAKKLDKDISFIRRDEKWRLEYMRLMERDIDNKRLGRRIRSVEQVRKFRNRYNIDELAEICFITPDLLQAIKNAIDAHPDWDDETVAENVDFD